MLAAMLLPDSNGVVAAGGVKAAMEHDTLKIVLLGELHLATVGQGDLLLQLDFTVGAWSIGVLHLQRHKHGFGDLVFAQFRECMCSIQPCLIHVVLITWQMHGCHGRCRVLVLSYLPG